MIAFEHLTKNFGELAAVRDLGLSVEQGEVFGFLGPNGAGKTTTIRLMMGILVPSRGRVTIDGLDCQRHRVEVKQHVGYLPDNPMFYDHVDSITSGETVAVGPRQALQQSGVPCRSL